MNIQAALNRIDKMIQAAQSTRLTQALWRYRVLAGAEHRHVLSCNLETVVDIGANRGQFSLAVRQWAPQARVISFEPLPGPASVFLKVFYGDDRVLLRQAAIGPHPEQRTMHVSARDDSSSLLPIASLQEKIFPGTAECSTIEVQVAPLDDFLKEDDIEAPAMLKLDVQGFEYEALAGCESLLSRFNFVYCECSFVELYSGQKLAADVIKWLAERGLRLSGIFNPAYDAQGQSVQADFLFCRVTDSACAS
jgi:FkbM family methyltransferase